MLTTKRKHSSKQNCDQDMVNTLEHKATEEIQRKTSQRLQNKSLKIRDLCILHSQHFVIYGNWLPPSQPLLLSVRIKGLKMAGLVGVNRLVTS